MPIKINSECLHLSSCQLLHILTNELHPFVAIPGPGREFMQNCTCSFPSLYVFHVFKHWVEIVEFQWSDEGADLAVQSSEVVMYEIVELRLLGWSCLNEMNEEPSLGFIIWFRTAPICGIWQDSNH